jgi:thiamine-monophosphate kinase
LNPGRSAAVSLGEFELIERWFARLGAQRDDVVLGVGDDGALLAPHAGEQLVAVLDTLVEGTHFLPGSPPESVGHRALAVNLSDIAAMGAEPAWALLALTLPRIDAAWLEGFARGFGQLAKRHSVALVGGDTTRGPLSISVQLQGFVPPGAALRRSGAQPGDLLCVTGTPGDAAAGLEIARRADGPADTAARALLERFLYPTPRLAAGRRLRDFASACIDVSDGLAGDAGKLAAASGCGVMLDAAALPLSAALRAVCGETAARRHALTGGDDYELCFALPPARLAALRASWPERPAAGDALVWTVIGALRAAPGIEIRDGDSVIQVSHSGFDHFGG